MPMPGDRYMECVLCCQAKLLRGKAQLEGVQPEPGNSVMLEGDAQKLKGEADELLQEARQCDITVGTMGCDVMDDAHRYQTRCCYLLLWEVVATCNHSLTELQQSVGKVHCSLMQTRSAPTYLHPLWIITAKVPHHRCIAMWQQQWTV